MAMRPSHPALFFLLRACSAAGRVRRALPAVDGLPMTAALGSGLGALAAGRPPSRRATSRRQHATSHEPRPSQPRGSACHPACPRTLGSPFAMLALARHPAHGGTRVERLYRVRTHRGRARASPTTGPPLLRRNALCCWGQAVFAPRPVESWVATRPRAAQHNKSALKTKGKNS